MKTEMRKSNKTLLALVVVAALAAVSFAGIALSDDSDAVLISNNIVIQPGETDTKDYNFYEVESDFFFQAFEFVVMAGGSYTGTISLGTAKADMTDYAAYASIKLTGASAVRITGMMYNSEFTGEVVAVFMIGNVDKAVGGTLPSGTFELTKGQIILGSPYGVTKSEWKYAEDQLSYASSVTDVLSFMNLGFTYLVNQKEIVAFNGTVSAGDLSVTSSYTVGTMISLTAAGDARLSSFYATASPNEALPYDAKKLTGAPLNYPNWEDRTLSISGTASVQYPEVAQRILDRSLGDVLAVWPGILGNPTYGPLFSDRFAVDAVNVTFEEGAVITVGDRGLTVAENVAIDTGAAADLAILIGSDGKIYEASISATRADFGYVPFGTYTLIMVLPGDYLYYGTATVSGSEDKSSISIGYNQLSPLSGAIDDADLTIATPTSIQYGYPYYSSTVFAFNYTNGVFGNAVKDADGEVINGAIGFNGGILPTDEVFIVLKRSLPGDPLMYFWGVVGTNDATGLIKIKTGTAALASDEIRAVGGLTKSTTASIVALDASKFLIKGEVNVLYGKNNEGIMNISAADAYLNFEGTGILSYGVAPALITAPPSEILGGTPGRVVAAYFFENEPATGAPSKTTYYFTTLDNALTLSGDITLTGKHVILKDTTFTNDKFPTMKVRLAPLATLEIGKIKDAGSDAVSAILTIPSTTEVIVDPTAQYNVINGQAVYDVKPISAYEPGADILITRVGPPAKYIYTDLATALSISISGDELVLRQNATLRSDATLKEGVTLKDAAAKNLTIETEVILTVNGTLISEFNMVINGTLRINGVANFIENAAATLNGTIIVTSAGELNLKKTASITGTDGVIDVAGKVNLENNSTISVATFVLTGTANIAVNATFTVGKRLQIGEQPTLSPLSGTYTNTAAIKGKITLATEAVAYVYGAFSLSDTGTNANIILPSGTLKKTEYKIGGELYVTLYTSSGSTTTFLPILYEDQLLDIVIYRWNNERMLRGDWLVKDTYLIGASDWTIVYADFEFKKYTVTFYYLQGMTWVCNGLDQAGGAAIQVEYGKTVSVTGVVQPGYTGTPVLRTSVNGGAATAYTPGTAFKVTGDVNFTATGVQLASEPEPDNGLTLIEILLIIIVIIIAIIALIIAVRLLRS